MSISEGIRITKTPLWEIRFRSAEANLGPAERKVYDHILANPDKVIHQSITVVAQEADASESTVVRLCRRVGYKGFQGLKIAIAKELVPTIRVIHESVEGDDDIGSIKRKVFYSSMQALQDTVTIVEDGELQRAVDAISTAKKFDIYGLGGSGCIAADAHHKFVKIGVRSNAYNDCNIQAMSAALLGPGDVAMAISHSGSVKDVVEALQIAQKRGATTISITHYSRSPITDFADIKLFTTASEMMFRSDAMTSRIAQLAIIDTLYVGVALKLGESASAALDSVREAVATKGF